MTNPPNTGATRTVVQETGTTGGTEITREQVVSFLADLSETDRKALVTEATALHRTKHVAGAAGHDEADRRFGTEATR